MRRRNILWCFLWLPISRRSLGRKLRVGVWEGEKGPGCVSWKEFLQDTGESVPESARWEEPVAHTYTGGTTGPAKGVMLSRRAFRASLEQYTQVGTMYGRGGATLVLLPLFSAFGLCQCVHVPLCLGMTIILYPMFRPEQLGEMLRALSSGTGQRNHLLLAAASPGPVGGPSRPVFPAGPTLRRRCHDGGDGATDQ